MFIYPLKRFEYLNFSLRTPVFYEYVYQLINIILTVCYTMTLKYGQYTDIASLGCIIDLGLVFLGTE